MNEFGFFTLLFGFILLIIGIFTWKKTDVKPISDAPYHVQAATENRMGSILCMVGGGILILISPIILFLI